MSTKVSSFNEKIKDLKLITPEEIKKNFNDIISSNIPIWRMKKDGSLVIIPAIKLEHFLGDQDSAQYKFYIGKEWEKGVANTPKKQEPAKSQKWKKNLEKKGEFKDQLSNFKKMSVKERGDILDNNIKKIQKQAEMGEKIDPATIINMVNVVIDTFYVNKASLEDNMESLLSKDNLKLIIEKTKLLVDSIITMLEQESVTYRDLNKLEKISTDSVTIDHINKVILRFIPFCIFYNEFFTDGLIKKIRARFSQHFKKYYRKLAPNTNISLEVIFKKGIRRITREEIHDYAIGALFHDIGKLPDVNYHDSSPEYNRRNALAHAVYGYNMMIKSKEFPMSVAIMTALHHEFYGHKTGYDISKVLLSKLNKNYSGDSTINYFISYDVDDIINESAIAFFPCKLLEIIDVFDELTDKNNPMAKEKLEIKDALKIMKDNYVIKSLKLDPILFNIFVEFIKVYSPIADPAIMESMQLM